MAWNYIEQGSGRPLVLLHGIGMSAAAWKTVMPRLARERRVIAVDVAGFGRTPPLANGVPPTGANLATALGDTLRELGIDTPVDIAGNSMGGFIALEAAKQGLARSVVGISPGGLWKAEGISLHTATALRLTRWAAINIPGVAHQAMQFAALRSLIMALPVSVSSWKMPAADAVQCTKVFAAATAFDETLHHASHFSGGTNLRIPVTVAFGSRDWLLTASAQHRDELPAHTRWIKPRGWGHVPMWDDPAGVATLILEGTA
ncbi:MAG: alpha/beta hydrolase [bacterium]|nr:alpha/beta hydrolase [bacterium]